MIVLGRQLKSGSGHTVVAPAALALALVLTACGGSGDGASTPTAGGAGVRIVVEMSDLALGPNRLLLAVTDEQQNEVLGARLVLRFFFIDPAADDRKTLKNSTSASPIEAINPYSHTHVNGAVVNHQAGETNIQLANVAFDAAGEWVVEITGDIAGKRLPLVEESFQVARESLTPRVGRPAPPSRQPILTDVSSIEEIDLSQPPNPETHTMTIAAAVASGRPTVIAFASAGVCASDICGPAKEIFDDLWAEHKHLANFIHVEPYAQDADDRLTVLPWLREEWGVQDQPWLFVVDSAGIVSAKFQVAAGLDELEAALLPLVTAPDAGGSGPTRSHRSLTAR